MRALTLVIFIIGFSHIVGAQTAPPATKWTDEDQRHRVNLYSHLGTVLLPDGFEGALTSDWNDAWGGYMQSRNGDFRILWSAGLIERPLEKLAIQISWSKPQQIGDTSIVLGEGKTKSANFLVADIGRYPIHFVARIKNDSDKETFLKIINSYKAERCPVCKSLRLEDKVGVVL